MRPGTAPTLDTPRAGTLAHVAQEWEPVLRPSNMRLQKVRARQTEGRAQ